MVLKQEEKRDYRLCPRCELTTYERECPRCGADLTVNEKTLVIRDKSLQSGFSQVPNVILRTPYLSSNAKCVYALLLSYAWQSHECFPGQDTLASHMGCTRQTVSSTLHELRTAKLISWKRRGLGKVNIYYIEPLEKFMPKGFHDTGVNF